MSAGALGLVVLISGRGSNLEALISAQQQGRLPINILAVISNRPDAKGLGTARQHGINCTVVDHTEFPDRQAFDLELLEQIRPHEPALVVLAGFMRVLGEDIVSELLGKAINIHPSLLPAYPGLHTHARVLAAGDREHGASMHFVTGELDGGPVISQVRMPVLGEDTPESLAARLLPMEHRLMLATVELFSRGSVELREHAIHVNQQILDKPLELAADGQLGRAAIHQRGHG